MDMVDIYLAASRLGNYPPLTIDTLTVFLELRSRKTVRYSEQIMSADKYPSLVYTTQVNSAFRAL